MALRRFFKGAAVYTASAAALKALSLVLAPIYMRFLTVEEYGAVGLAESAAAVLALVAGLSMPAAMSRLYFNYEGGERERFVASLLTGSLTTSAIALIALLVVGPFVVESLRAWWSLPFYPIFGLALASRFLAGWLGGWNRLLQTEERPKAFAVVQLTRALITAAGVLGLVVAYDGGGAGLIGGRLLGAAAVVAGVVVAMGGRLRAKKSWAMYRASVRFGAPLIPFFLMVMVLEVSDRFVIEAYLGTERVGVYTHAAVLGGVMIIINRALYSAWQPIFYKRVKTPEGRTQIGRDAPYVLLASSLIATAGIVISGPFNDLVFDARYREAGALIPWVLGGFAIYNVFVLANLQILQTERGSVSSVIAVVSGGANLGLNIWLVPIYGITAAAITTLAAYAMQAILGFAIGQWLRPIRYAAAPGVFGLILVAGSIAITQVEWGSTALAWGTRGATLAVAAIGLLVIARRRRRAA